jgi:hypothetical protein
MTDKSYQVTFLSKCEDLIRQVPYCLFIPIFHSASVILLEFSDSVYVCERGNGSEMLPRPLSPMMGLGLM